MRRRSFRRMSSADAAQGCSPANGGPRPRRASFLTTAADIFYVTGFLTRFWESPTRPWFVVVPAVASRWQSSRPSAGT